ncbi:hypothetical protein B0T25DRAFT_556698 [Lasiosphaeria hispida]|uniref:Pentatricopeptide repeat protein n=1 Tax=Lasiosphaeria hispida TaxID=260671 RepID=A0AAJ0H9K8_9PEZI|nr:hypothetical protein B0T25DRAFT_556698 [Lasiosphaeria hispida]
MKVSSRIDGSICGAIFLPRLSSNWPAALVVARAGPSLYSYGGGRFYCGSCCARHRGGSSLRRQLIAAPVLQKANIHDGTFFHPSIPPSGYCKNHTVAAPAPPLEPDTEPQLELDLGDAIVRPQQRRLRRPPLSLTKTELLALVEPYDSEETSTLEDHLQYARDPYMRGYAPADGPTITIARSKEDADYPSPEEVTQPNDEERQTLWSLRFAVITRLRNREKVDLDTIYETYQRLPEPRIPYLSGRFRHQLLRALGQPDKKSPKSMLRYFAVIADIKDSGIPLTRSQWNCAISFASRYVGVSTESETEAALKLWREMEFEAGLKGSDVTFNILFDVASKSGNFTLAEMIYKEMESRGHVFNRYHYVSLIHFFGLRLDTSGMRAAYVEMVEAGEIIDTVALNAVLSGLLRSGEEAAAERLYERMKASAADKKDLPPRTYSSNRAITQALLMFAKIGRRHPSMQPTFQDIALIHPDIRTYGILINHYGVKRGNLGKVAKYVDEMKFFQIPLHGAIFLALFKGFSHHGGQMRSAWSEQRLLSIWSAFLRAVDEGAPGLEIKTWLAIWILRAFHKCSAGDSVLDIYEALEDRWHLDDADEQFMVDFIANLVNR